MDEFNTLNDEVGNQLTAAWMIQVVLTLEFMQKEIDEIHSNMLALWVRTKKLEENGKG
jgi:hypothetical protein